MKMNSRTENHESIGLYRIPCKLLMVIDLPSLSLIITRNWYWIEQLQWSINKNQQSMIKIGMKNRRSQPDSANKKNRDFTTDVNKTQRFSIYCMIHWDHHQTPMRQEAASFPHYISLLTVCMIQKLTTDHQSLGELLFTLHTSYFICLLCLFFMDMGQNWLPQ